MEGTLKTATSILSRVVALRAFGEKLTRMAVAGALGGLAALAVIAAVGCAIAGLWMAVEPEVGRAGAALIAAGALVLVGAILVLVAWLMLRRKPKAKVQSMAQAAQLVDGARAAGYRVLRDHKGTLLLVATIGGLLASGSVPGFRRRGRGDR
jgi:hypothetical protein